VLALVAGTYFAARLVGTWELYLFAFAFLAALVLSWLLVLATRPPASGGTDGRPRRRPMAGEEAIHFQRQVMRLLFRGRS